MHKVIKMKNSIFAINNTVQELLDQLQKIVSPLLEEERQNVHLALIEAITNAICWGNEGNCEKFVTISYEMDKDKATFSIEDQGRGFDYRSLKPPLEDLDLYEEHGRGIYLIQNLMDEVYFNEKGNKIIMIKNFKSVE